MARNKGSSRSRRVVAVGYGQMGRGMARLIERTPWTQLVGVVDRDEDVQAAAANDYGLPSSCVGQSLVQVLRQAQPDLVIVNTPSELHYRQIMTALNHGCHVLAAKPLAATLPQALRIVQHARNVGRKVVVGQQIRFNRHYLAVARFLASGAIGTVESVYLLNSKPRPQPMNLGEIEQPALLEMACHHFDALLAIFPFSQPHSIMATGYRPSWSEYKGYCMVNAMMELTGGVHVLYHGGFSAQAPCYELRLEGTNGTLRCRGIHMSAGEFSYEVATVGGEFATAYLEALVPERSPWDVYMEHWHRYLTRGTEPVFSARRNLPVIALLDAGAESMARGRRVQIEGSARYAEALNA